MNRKQRIVLIIGAAALLIIIIPLPYYFGPRLYYNGYHRGEVGEAFLRAFGVIGATLLVAHALKDKKENKP